ncbi:acrosin-like [Notamacropus eugenii]|uniref:acrosin-like n=1 Tax=Notamacropus eugenii TaxID=9315 RepID=UPI003B67C58A
MVGTRMLWHTVLLSLLGTVGVDAQTTCSGVCGERPMIHKFGTRIVGGVKAQPGSWPWIVSIEIVYYEGRWRHHVCGGSVIAPTWVLSAAHCFVKNASNLNLWRLLIGAWEIQFGWIEDPMHPAVQERKPIKIIVHEHYNKDYQLNDIALIQLDRPIKCGDFAKIACLPRPREAPVEPGEKCYIAGWGHLKEGAKKPSPILQQAQVNIIDTRICNGTLWYSGWIFYNNLCAGYKEGKIDTCQGDSGGPLMCKDKRSGTYVVVGITSWGSGCAQAFKPGIYTSTWHFLDWISRKIGPTSAYAVAPLTTTPPTTTPPTTTSPRPYSRTLILGPPKPWMLTTSYKPWTARPWWLRTTQAWYTGNKPWKGASPQMWPHTDQPWPPGSPLSHPPMYTALQPWISSPGLVKAQVLGPNQALPLTLSFPKRLRLLMDSMKSNKSV